MPSKNFILENSTSQLVLEKITDIYALNKITEQKCKYIFYDTFDWRLYFNKVFFYLEGTKACLDGNSIDFTENAVEAATFKDKKFWWDLPQSDLREYLRKIVDVRALLKILSLDIIRCDFEVLNEERKIIAKISVLNIVSRSISSYSTFIIKLVPVKGYKNESKPIVDILRKYSSKLKIDYGYWGLIFKKSGIKPVVYSTKPDRKSLGLKASDEFHKDQATYVAIKNLLLFILEVLRKNIPGIVKDIDTEFLHDFRVLIRRTRSSLTQLENVFTDEITATYRDLFAKISNSTNKARDLDVFIITLISLKEKIPQHLTDGLGQIFDYLYEEKSVQYKKLKNLLTRQHFKNVLINWEIFLKDTDIKYAAEMGYKLVNETARYFIFKSLNKVSKKYNILLSGNTPVNMHQLRISCKKLRYVLELFNIFYNNNIYTKVLDHLKALQDASGLYQDLEVQKNMLIEILNELKKCNKINEEISLTAGYIFRIFEEKQRQIPANFIDLYNNFEITIKSKKFKRILEE